jgi:hypothetical protein
MDEEINATHHFFAGLLSDSDKDEIRTLCLVNKQSLEKPREKISATQLFILELSGGFSLIGKRCGGVFFFFGSGGQ